MMKIYIVETLIEKQVQIHKRIYAYVYIEKYTAKRRQMNGIVVAEEIAKQLDIRHNLNNNLKQWTTHYSAHAILDLFCLRVKVLVASKSSRKSV